MKQSLKDFTDRELLEFILCNQVYFERQLGRIESALYKQDNDYYKADKGHLSDNFQTLLSKSQSTKELIKEQLKENPVTL